MTDQYGQYESIQRRPERDIEKGVHGRIVVAHLDNARHALGWLMMHGKLSDELTKYVVNAYANVDILKRRLGV